MPIVPAKTILMAGETFGVHNFFDLLWYPPSSHRAHYWLLVFLDCNWFKYEYPQNFNWVKLDTICYFVRFCSFFDQSQCSGHPHFEPRCLGQSLVHSPPPPAPRMPSTSRANLPLGSLIVLLHHISLRVYNLRFLVCKEISTQLHTTCHKQEPNPMLLEMSRSLRTNIGERRLSVRWRTSR